MYRSLYNYYNISRESDVTKRGLYNYYEIVEGEPTPLIYSLSESRATEGQYVTITGAGFGFGTTIDTTNANRWYRSYGGQVYIGTTLCEIPDITNAWTWSQITFVVPSGATSGPVTVKLTSPAVVTSNPIGLEIYEPTVGDDTGLELFLCDKEKPNTIICQLEGAFNKSFQTILSQPGSGRFTISKRDPKYQLITDQSYILCRLDGENVFKWVVEMVEPSIVSSDEQELVDISGRGVLSVLERVVVYPYEFPYHSSGVRTFTNKNAAFILKILIDEGILRGVFYDDEAGFYYADDLINGTLPAQTYLIPEFTLTTDSLGNLVDEDVTISFTAGTPLSEVVAKLSDGMGLIDVEVTADMKVRIYKIFESGTSRATYFPGQAIVNMSHQRQSGNMTNTLLVEGPNGVLIEVAHPTKMNVWGRREGFLKAENTSELRDVVSNYGYKYFKRTGGVIESIQGTVLKYVDSDGNTLKPFESFRLGEWITWVVADEYSPMGSFNWRSVDWRKVRWGGTVPLSDFYRQDVRVKAITVEENNDTGEILYTLDLNNLKLENEIKVKQLLDRLAKNSQNDPLSS
jgi:hypothetical protein